MSSDSMPGRRGALRKRADWLQAGNRIVWVIDPLRDAARVHRAEGSIDAPGLEDTLYGDPVLCGFTVCSASS